MHFTVFAFNFIVGTLFVPFKLHIVIVLLTTGNLVVFIFLCTRITSAKISMGNYVILKIIYILAIDLTINVFLSGRASFG